MGYDRHLLKRKVEWEGGILATLEYGIHASDIDDPELAAAWAALSDAYEGLVPLMSVVDKLLRTTSK